MIPLASIAFDIDGVVANTMGLFINIAREKYNLSIQYEQIKQYDLTQCLEIEFNIVWDIFQQIMDGNHSQSLEPMDQALEVLQKLCQNQKLLFVTARPDSRALVSWFLNTLQLSESQFNIIATGDFQQKITVLKDHGIQYFVEDRMETCHLLDKHGLTPIVFSQPWNQGESHAYIEVHNWDELYKLMDKP